MDKQVIIAIGREFGSGGRVIAQELAKRLELPLYDKNLLEYLAQEKNVSQESLQKYDELPKNKLISRKVRGLSNSPQENIAEMQFEYLQKLAAEGQSFVVVGRCAEIKLKVNPGLISIFVLGDRESKESRIMELQGISREDAKQMLKRMDWQRKSYHNYYCKGKWGDSRNYDLSINSSRLGIEGTVDMLETYIRKRVQ